MKIVNASFRVDDEIFKPGPMPLEVRIRLALIKEGFLFTGNKVSQVLATGIHPLFPISCWEDYESGKVFYRQQVYEDLGMPQTLSPRVRELGHSILAEPGTWEEFQGYYRRKDDHSVAIWIMNGRDFLHIVDGEPFSPSERGYLYWCIGHRTQKEMGTPMHQAVVPEEMLNPPEEYDRMDTPYLIACGIVVAAILGAIARTFMGPL